MTSQQLDDLANAAAVITFVGLLWKALAQAIYSALAALQKNSPNMFKSIFGAVGFQKNPSVRKFLSSPAQRNDLAYGLSRVVPQKNCPTIPYRDVPLAVAVS